MSPTISVIMATYNTPNKWLSESIRSILNQTFSDFEFIIVDDCSTTDISVVKNEFSDYRIVWLKNQENLGLTKSLNIALKIAKGKYIVRMDADDISLPDRFQMQVEYMEKNPKVIVCGSWRRTIGTENKDEIWNLPKTRENQQVQLFFFNCGLTHPTAMFRKAMLDKYGIHYNENYKKAQDYGIWVQCTRFAPMAMMQSVLLLYRKSENQVTANKASVKEYASMVRIDQLSEIGIQPTEEEKKMHIAFCEFEPYADCNRLKDWIDRLYKANETHAYFDRNSFNKVLKQRWYIYCKTQYRIHGLENYKTAYYQSRVFSFFIKDIVIWLKTHIMRTIRK